MRVGTGACATGTGVRAFLGLGSNVGRRQQALSAAICALEDAQHLCVVRSASVYETEPIGVPDQPWFLNTAVEVCTGLSPRALLGRCKAVENQLGRRPSVRWGPREIDVDVLLYGQWLVREPDLWIPHPQMRHRKFVLAPLLELIPQGVDPVSGVAWTALVVQIDDAKKVELLRKRS